MEFDLFDPVFDVHEGFSLVDGIGEDDAHGSSVVGLGDGFELFLSSRVPDLQSNSFFAYHDGFGFEIDADGREMRCHEIILTKFEKHVSLADAAVADDQQFNQAIVSLVATHWTAKKRELIAKTKHT